MKTIQFNDLNGDELTVQHSSNINESYRIYLKGEQYVEQEDNTPQKNKIPVCIHLSRNQAELLISALKDLFGDND